LDSIEFGKFIAELRKRAGYDTQAALGKASGIENSTISRIETGDTKNPNVETLKKLAPFLQVPPEKLMEAAGYIQEDLPISDFLKKTREVSGVSIETLSRAINLPISELQRIENNISIEEVSIRTFTKITDYFKIPRGKLFHVLISNGLFTTIKMDEFQEEINKEIKESKITTEELEIIKRFRKLSPGFQTAVLDLINSLEKAQFEKNEQASTSEVS
jgi:transcriptional regulator with XRE-family HTH domain